MELCGEYSSAPFFRKVSGCRLWKQLRSFQGRLGFLAVGIDVEIAGDLPLRTGMILKASTERLPFRNGVFQIVFSSHALEHFDDRDAALRETFRVLDPNGIAIIIVPTGTVAFISLITHLLFTNHIRRKVPA